MELRMNEGKTKFNTQNIENPDTIKALGNTTIEKLYFYMLLMIWCLIITTLFVLSCGELVEKETGGKSLYV